MKIQYVFVIMYGKRPIAVYKSEMRAKVELKSLNMVLPKSYPVKAHIEKVPIE